jgi:hypothetical protein
MRAFGDMPSSIAAVEAEAASANLEGGLKVYRIHRLLVLVQCHLLVDSDGFPVGVAGDDLRLGVSEALYLRDPDSNGLELCWDRPREEWPRTPQGDLAMTTLPLDLDDLLREVGAGNESSKIGRGPLDL